MEGNQANNKKIFVPFDPVAWHFKTCATPNVAPQYALLCLDKKIHSLHLKRFIVLCLYFSLVS